MTADTPSDPAAGSTLEASKQFVNLDDLISSGDTTFVEVEERRSNIQLRQRIANWVLVLYTASLFFILEIGAYEGIGIFHLGESFKWLIGIVAGQVSLLGLVIRGLFKV